MSQTVPDSLSSPVGIPLSHYRHMAREWVLDGELRQLSIRTLTQREDYLAKFFWFTDREAFTVISVRELKGFFYHLNHGHTEPGGRFGISRLSTPLRPVSLKGWHVVLSAWHGWMVEQEYMPANPMKKVPAPIARVEVKQPLTLAQVRRLLRAAKRTGQAKRDQAMLLFLADTGVRVSELIRLKIGDVDLRGRTFTVLGKGNKARQGYLGEVTTKALKTYLRSRKDRASDYLFESEKGSCGAIGDPLTRSGVDQLLKRLASDAELNVQVSAHQFRRFASVEFLRAGGSVFALQDLLGHASLHMTRRYCALAEADIEAQHRKFSPGDRVWQV